ncbi:MFS transporter [Polynucleobacter sphagniphilus]|jgi:MFS family permease|uniref:MFS family permease n=1 Tax=Polynucleobacter sphagniphilus TaxID=1743169 RepID=A0AA43S4V4_9BURK|nr:MFS transporter [Polynucleobacter sphagniphilus]MDF9788882.1 MFS family permease [Polynucleobacter sphagniphilus]MDH6154621.1 MFS family permease [Polynucleobacter sphagniphilus]MDH6241400.1 MFS family permease [Polynucleobacter sphagniphilus]MDH6249984.1 MFS family permease [Polynucleobacter sphagniphilus]MDH6300351.1 MFS family permease [Polynucleobacter sphagniphilus]
MRFRSIGYTPFMLLAQTCGLLGFGCYAVVLMPLQVEWQLSNLQSGLIASAFFFGYMLIVPLATALTDRIDARKVYLLGALSASAGLLGMGLFASGFKTGLCFMVLNGAGLAGTYMPGLKILSDRIQAGELTRHIAFYTAFFGIGTGISYLASGWILHGLGWRYVFGLIALGPLSAFLIVLCFIPALTHEKWNGPIHIRLRDIFPIAKWREVLKDKNAAGFIFGYTAHCIELFASRSWIVAFFGFCATVSGDGFIFAATTLAGLVNFFGVPSSILGNEMALRMGRQKWICLVMLGSAVMGIVLALSTGQSWWVIVVLAIAHTVFIMADSATLTAGLVISAQENIKGAAMGLHSLMGFGGGMLGPALFGFVLDLSASKHSQISWVWAYFSVVIWGVLFVLYERRHGWSGRLKTNS